MINGIEMEVVAGAIKKQAQAARKAIAPINRLQDALGGLGGGQVGLGRQDDAIGVQQRGPVAKPLGNLQEKIRRAADDILILQGRATQTGIELRRMIEGGAQPREVEHLRQILAFRERIIRQQRVANAAQLRFLNKQSKIAQDFADAQAVRSAKLQALFERTRTPSEKLREETKDLLDLLGKRRDAPGRDLLNRGLIQAVERFKSLKGIRETPLQQAAIAAKRRAAFGRDRLRETDPRNRRRLTGLSQGDRGNTMNRKANEKSAKKSEESKQILGEIRRLLQSGNVQVINSLQP